MGTMADLDSESAKSQISHMTQFILHEAKEKADEIDAKAQQDYTMEKQRVVEDEKLKIRKEYERRERGLTSQAKIDGAKETNKARIAVLKKQSTLLEEVVTEAGAKLEAVANNAAEYRPLLEGLIEQGLSKIQEEDILLRC